MRKVIDNGSNGDIMTTPSIDRDPETGIPLDTMIIQEDKDVEVGASSETHEEIKDVVPNGGYGWVNVGCVVLQNSATWGTFHESLARGISS
jgi:hypothetical protein